MNTLARAACRLSILLFPFSVIADPGDESKEPPRPYTLQVGERVFDAALGEKITVDGSYTDPVVVIRAGEYRTFDAGGVSFDYPAFFGWEADTASASQKIWTLSGNDFKVIYTYSKARIDPDKYVASFRERLSAAAAAPPANTELELGGAKTPGKQLSVKIGGYGMIHRVFSFKVKNGYGLFAFQDSDNEGRGSEEGAKALAVLTKSFRIH